MKAVNWASEVPEGARGFAYRPDGAAWFVKSGGVLCDWSGAQTDLSTAFHVRAFDGAVDLTWERDGDGWAQRRVDVGVDADMLTTTALLWGAVTTSDGDWAYLEEDRIRGFWVPCAATRGSTVRLLQRELLARDAHGNVYVEHNVLVGIEVADA